MHLYTTLNQCQEELRAASMALGLLRLQLEAGANTEAKSTLVQIQQGLNVLRLGLEGELSDAEQNECAEMERELCGV